MPAIQVTESSICLAKVMSLCKNNFFSPANRSPKCSFFIEPDGYQVCTTSEKIDLSESAVDIFLSGEIGPVVVDHVALFSCPGVVLISIAFVVFDIVIIVNISS